jgi:hypothetical protein
MPVKSFDQDVRKWTMPPELGLGNWLSNTATS